MLKIKKYVRIVDVGEGSEEESEIVLEMARRCKPFLECISVTYSLNHPEKGKNVKYVSKLNFFVIFSPMTRCCFSWPVLSSWAPRLSSSPPCSPDLLSSQCCHWAPGWGRAWVGVELYWSWSQLASRLLWRTL